jgi:hypothetical protein
MRRMLRSGGRRCKGPRLPGRMPAALCRATPGQLPAPRVSSRKLPALGAASCDVYQDGRSPDSASDSQAPESRTGIVLKQCGPADGLALAFIFAPRRLECPPAGCVLGACPPVQTPPTRDVITLYRNLPTGSTTIAFAASGPNGAGEASSCRAGTCTPATDIELVLTAFSRTTGAAAGSYTLRFPDGSAVSATFVANVCENSIFWG